jgi:signal transduction histidine kinase
VVTYSLGGAVAGYAAHKLREAEREVGLVRAREEVARTLHDGVLQTLAVVQRRSDDDELVRLARDQEQELRHFLFGTEPARHRRRRGGTGVDLEAALRDVVAHVGRRDGLRAVVVVAGDLRPVSAPIARAVRGAVAEALTNAAKHGHAAHATVFVDPGDDEDLFCSVKDDGTGFDPTSVVEGEGLTRSVRGRLHEVGGRAEIDGRPGRGAEVRLWIPKP